MSVTASLITEAILHDREFRRKKGIGKFGIYFQGERAPMTNYDIVDYDSYANAYKALIHHGRYRYQHDKDLYKAAIDELLEKGDLQIKLIT